MVDVIHTSIVSKARQVELDGQLLDEIPSAPDGNCALNAAALGVIDLIKRDALKLEEEKQQMLVSALLATSDILVQRVNLYRGRESNLKGTAYHDMADELERFVSFIQQPFSYQDLLQYIKNNTNNRLQVSALHVALAPALRNIGAQFYREQLQNIGAEAALQQDAVRLMAEGEWAGHEILTPLAHDFLGVNLKLHDSLNAKVLAPAEEIVNAPVIHLLHVPGHWNYLFPVSQKDGLSEVLSGVPPINKNRALLSETRSLVSLEKYFAKQFIANKDRIARDLPEAAGIIMQASENLLAIRDQKSLKQADIYEALSNRHLHHTESVLKSVRKNLHLTKKDVESMKLVSDLEKQLLLGQAEKMPADVVVSAEDERLARTLQNAEVLSFLSNHYTVLSGGRLHIHAKPQNEPSLPLVPQRKNTQ